MPNEQNKIVETKTSSIPKRPLRRARNAFTGEGQRTQPAEELSPQEELKQKIEEQFRELNTTAEFSLNIKEGGLIDAKTREWNQDYTGFSYDTPAFRIFKLLFINEFLFEQKMDVTYVDIDLRNLKAINDLFTHEGGDKAIATYYLDLVAKAQNVLESKGKTFYFIPHRLQAGGDELRLIIGGDIDLEELNQIITDLIYTSYAPQFGEEKTITLGAEYAGVQINQQDLLEQIKKLEKEIELPEEKKKNILELEKMDKAHYLLELMQGKAEITVVNRKREQLVAELQKIEEDAIAIFLNGATNEEELKKDIDERKNKIDQIFYELGTRRPERMGMAYIGGLQEIFILVIDRLRRNEELPPDLKFKIRMVTERVQNQAHVDIANAAAGEQLEANSRGA